MSLRCHCDRSLIYLLQLWQLHRFSVYVPEKEFSAMPVQLNQSVQVAWRSEDAIRLNV